MNPQSMIEYNTLGWVKPQLDNVLSDAQANLSEYIENGTPEQLVKCIEHLQLIHGTLEMVEVFGASMLAEEMQHTTEALVDGNVSDVNATYDVLMRAMLQMPDYLENVQAGRRDNPITLMPLMNDLRAVRKQSLLTQGLLFSPDIENAQLFPDNYDADAIKPGRLQDEVKRLRTHYQLGLLDYIRNKKESAGLQRIRAVLTSLEKVSSNTEVRHIWMVTGALVEGLLNNGIEKNSSIEMLLGGVDRQLKLVLECGEDEFSSQYSKELVSNILFYIALCNDDTKAIAAVKEAYRLSDLIASEEEHSGIAISGLNADLFDTVANGISEDMDHVKEILELFVHGSDDNTEQLVPVAEQLGKIADTYGIIGMDKVRQSLMQQRDVLQGIINGDVEAGEQVVLGIASEVLKAESELKDYIAERSGLPDAASGANGQNVPAAEYRQVVQTVASEALKNFTEAKAAILAYLSGNGGLEQLDIVLSRIEEVSGITMLLPVGRVEAQLKKLQNFIRIVLLQNNHQATGEEQDAIADVVTSIEYYIESLLEGRPGVEQGLDAGDKAISILELTTRFYGGDTDLSVENETDGSNSQVAEVIELTASEQESKPATSVEEAAETTVQGEYRILANDADEEIVEIFIEEADEVLAEMREYLPQWKADAENADALAVVRRGFHTLKGSGRLLGAELIGEFSWKYENVLNRLIDRKIDVSDALFQALDDALEVIPRLIEQIKGNNETIDNISLLMSAADALADGREVSFETDASEVEDSAEAQVTVDKSDTGEITEAGDNDSFDDIELDADNAASIDLAMDKGGADTDLDNGLDVIDENGVLNNVSNQPDLVYGLAEDAVASVMEKTGEEFIIDSESPCLIADETITGEVDSSIVPDIIIQEIDPVEESDDELIEISGLDEISDDFDTDEDANIGITVEDTFNIDPVLLKIYHDESCSHIETVRQLIDACESENQLLKADKELLRAFHTLYGSARTAEVEAIADLAVVTERYIKARQESEEEFIPESVTAVISDVEHAISAMLDVVALGQMPEGNKDLQEKINEFVQQELAVQAEKSHQQNAAQSGNNLLTENDGSSPGTGRYTDTTADVENIDHAEGIPPAEKDVSQVSYGDIDDELIDIFLEEAGELLESSENTLGEIKNEPEPTAQIHQLQRYMHTLKGGARMADLTPVGDLTHNLESLVDRVNDNKIDLDGACFDLLQESLDALTTMLGAVRSRQPLPYAGYLINRIEGLISGEAAENGPEENYLAEPYEADPATEEMSEVKDISISMPESLPDTEDILKETVQQETGNVLQEGGGQDQAANQQSEEEHKQSQDLRNEDRPHWGERASDVNFKESQEQVRVRSDLLNNLVNYAGEVNIFHARMAKQIADFSFNLFELSQTVVRLKEQLRNLEIETEIQIRSGYEKEGGNFDDNFDPLEMDQYSTLQQLTRSLSETAGDVDSINEILGNITRDSETLLVQESRISSDLQEGLMRTRMVRFGGLSSRLRRIVRQVSRELGKEVELEIQGEASEVDRTVLDRIIAPLEHMLRNAVAHGIEKPEARKILGKNETGNILIQVERQGSDVVINVKDDGAGIDADRIRKKAIKQGLISAKTKLSDRDALLLILHSGFTTADEVTQVAGRGVGMDVVDSEIKQLGGALEIDTVRGQSTEFRIRLPLTLAINQALLVSAADDVYAIPLSSIDGVVRVTGVELQQIYASGNNQYDFNGVEYELRNLGALLTGNQLNYSKQLKLFPVLLIHVGDQRFALHVEDLVGRREIVVKPVGLQIGSVHGIAGATILADGRVVLILEMSALAVADSLFKAAEAREVQIAAEDEMKTIMVIDDSITIRKITERILKRYGIEVILAKDGVDATNLLQDSVPDLILLDIEMPRMDGFEVASFVRNDARLKNTPIIMITSRTGSKHKEKAMEIGVNKYLGKPFQEDGLIRNINKILKTSYSLT